MYLDLYYIVDCLNEDREPNLGGLELSHIRKEWIKLLTIKPGKISLKLAKHILPLVSGVILPISVEAILFLKSIYLCTGILPLQRLYALSSNALWKFTPSNKL